MRAASGSFLVMREAFVMQVMRDEVYLCGLTFSALENA